MRWIWAVPLSFVASASCAGREDLFQAFVDACYTPVSHGIDPDPQVPAATFGAPEQIFDRYIYSDPVVESGLEFELMFPQQWFRCNWASSGTPEEMAFAVSWIEAMFANPAYYEGFGQTEILWAGEQRLMLVPLDELPRSHGVFIDLFRGDTQEGAVVAVSIMVAPVDLSDL